MNAIAYNDAAAIQASAESQLRTRMAMMGGNAKDVISQEMGKHIAYKPKSEEKLIAWEARIAAYKAVLA